MVIKTVYESYNQIEPTANNSNRCTTLGTVNLPALQS